MVKNSLQKAVIKNVQSRATFHAAFGNVFVTRLSQIAATGGKKQLKFYKGKLPYKTKIGGFFT